ncbi:DNA-binding NarL/FixJ family response regulator [Pseudoduganella lurida]|uniref:DNA-binding NarL/FixJ family response regulator n=1 Tax=Pseudoduganella lurida TaxID=1036180 RepID=A0A562RJ07_9BURK|nr:response regulator transcription factor [Pseudoduganella lurida]TWI69072.1 DNA-binding NarL/FixJ family response regulator [Pseudoduganella lurida]
MHATLPHVHIMHADPVMTAGLHALLAEHGGFTLTTQSRQPHAQGQAHVLVTDHDTGIALARQLAGERFRATPRVLIVTQLDKEWQVRTAMDSGVHGYLLQNCAADELARAVHQLGMGMRYLSEAVTRCVADSLSREMLTGRETDVLQLLARGCCNKSIARELGIGVGTVKTHVKGLMSKLDATARTHAVVVAAQRGLIGAGARPLAPLPGRQARAAAPRPRHPVLQ